MSWLDENGNPDPEGCKRHDGVTIGEVDGLWLIAVPPKKFIGFEAQPPTTISACPCCGETMPTKRLAQLVADAVVRPG